MATWEEGAGINSSNATINEKHWSARNSSLSIVILQIKIEADEIESYQRKLILIL